MLKHNVTASRKKMPALKFFLLVFAGTVVAVLLHQLHHDPLMTLDIKPKSIVVTSGYFPPVAFASLALAFGIMGLMFLAIQKSLHGTKLRKGALFGIALGGMYFVGMLEAYVVYPVPLFGEIYTGAVDGLGILLTSLLLGKVLADDGPVGEKPAGPVFSAILIMLVTYVLIRYFSYSVLHIESSYSTRPLATFIWTGAMGGWVGLMYTLVGKNVGHGNSLKRAAVFGGAIFGINWLIFNLFALLFIEVPVLDLLYRSVFDALAVSLGAYLSSSLSTRQSRPETAARASRQHVGHRSAP